MNLEQLTPDASEERSPLEEEQKEAALEKAKKARQDKVRMKLQPHIMARLGFNPQSKDPKRAGEKIVMWRDQFFAEDYAQAFDAVIQAHPQLIDEYDDEHPEKLMNIVEQKLFEIKDIQEAE
jgi:hypothetical protein